MVCTHTSDPKSLGLLCGHTYRRKLKFYVVHLTTCTVLHMEDGGLRMEDGGRRIEDGGGGRSEGAQPRIKGCTGWMDDMELDDHYALDLCFDIRFTWKGTRWI